MEYPKIAFFGTPQIAVFVLEELEKGGVTPSLIITNPDAPQGRKLLMTPSPVALWGEVRHIPVLKLALLKGDEVPDALRASGVELSIAAAYGKIIPEEILNIPKYKTINMHPSLLPKLRGASPIRSAILEDMNPTGISIMILTPGMDEGPILAQEIVEIPKEKWPIRGLELDELLAKRGGALLSKILPEWIACKAEPKEQNHTEATYSAKITKEMGYVDLGGDPYQNLLKIRAFDGWPGTYFFHEKNSVKIRVKITDAEIENGSLKILRVIPEGKNEMSYEIFLQNN
jgi:methionyl-tRNA formyltransferase